MKPVDTGMDDAPVSGSKCEPLPDKVVPLLNFNNLIQKKIAAHHQTQISILFKLSAVGCSPNRALPFAATASILTFSTGESLSQECGFYCTRSQTVETRPKFSYV